MMKNTLIGLWAITGSLAAFLSIIYGLGMVGRFVFQNDVGGLENTMSIGLALFIVTSLVVGFAVCLWELAAEVGTEIMR